MRFDGVRMFAKLSHFLREHKVNLILMGVLLFCFLLPDPLMNVIQKSSRYFWNWYSFGFLVILSIGLSYSSRKFFFFSWSLFALLETLQLMHIAYFGSTFSPAAVFLLVHELRDVLEPVYFQFVWFVFPLVGVIYGFGALVFFKLSQRKKTMGLKSVFLVCYGVLLCATDGALMPTHRDVQRIWGGEFLETVTHQLSGKTSAHSLKSSICALSCATVFSAFKCSKELYLPYERTFGKPQAQNIVLVLGESLTPSHMSLFGYERPTTPFLESLGVDSSRTFFKKYYAAAPSTHVSLTYLFNALREPRNYDLINHPENNLCRMAQKQGFKITVITVNDGTRSLGSEIDQMYTGIRIDTHPEALMMDRLKGKRDSGLVEVFASLALATDKNFIIIHMYTPHSDCKKRYQEVPQFAVYPDNQNDGQDPINSYDNAVLLTDDILRSLFGEFERRFGKGQNNFFLLISDHGELFGEENPKTGENLWGHGHLTLPCLEAPFLLHGTSGVKDKGLQKMLGHPALSGFQVSKIVLKLLGVDLNNPNEDASGTYYATNGIVAGSILSYRFDAQGVPYQPDSALQKKES